jgi:hypothetical protein
MWIVPFLVIIVAIVGICVAIIVCLLVLYKYKHVNRISPWEKKLIDYRRPPTALSRPGSTSDFSRSGIIYIESSEATNLHSMNDQPYMSGKAASEIVCAGEISDAKIRELSLHHHVY